MITVTSKKGLAISGVCLFISFVIIPIVASNGDGTMPAEAVIPGIIFTLLGAMAFIPSVNFFGEKTK